MQKLPEIVVASLVIVSLAAPSAVAQAESLRTVLPTDDRAWRCGPPGLPGGSRFAIISGDPAHAGSFVIRVELPSGYRLPSYQRPRDENIVVLAGTIEVDARTLRSGWFIRSRANEWHSLSTRSGATVQIFGYGPFEMTAASR